jgi:hypothetical protein
MVKRRLIARKTYDVYFREQGSGIKDKVVLNAWNPEDVKRIMKRRFKGWTVTKIERH